MATAEGGRFASLSDGDIEKILDDRDSKNTKNVIKVAVKALNDYLSEKSGEFSSVNDLDKADAGDLCSTLRKFYGEIRKTDGSCYAKKSLITLRFGLQKHFLKSREEDIINNDQYQQANELFKAVLVQLKKEGLGEIKHKDSITPEDLNKLYESDSFSKDNPESLQHRVLFEYLYYYCNRGRENVREVQKDDFVIKTDARGRRYITIHRKRQTENHRGDDFTDTDDKAGRVYEKPGKKSLVFS